MEVLGSEEYTLRFDPESRTLELRTRFGLVVLLNDADQTITVRTPHAQSIVLDDGAKSITVGDANLNKWALGPAGITVSSPNDIVLSASGHIRLEGLQGVSLTSAGGSLTGHGLNVKLDADMSATMKGNASAEISALGQTTIRGAMVLIN